MLSSCNLERRTPGHEGITPRVGVEKEGLIKLNDFLHQFLVECPTIYLRIAYHTGSNGSNGSNVLCLCGGVLRVLIVVV